MSPLSVKNQQLEKTKQLPGEKTSLFSVDLDKSSGRKSNNLDIVRSVFPCAKSALLFMFGTILPFEGIDGRLMESNFLVM